MAHGIDPPPFPPPPSPLTLIAEGRFYDIITFIRSPWVELDICIQVNAEAMAQGDITFAYILTLLPDVRGSVANTTANCNLEESLGRSAPNPRRFI